MHFLNFCPTTTNINNWNEINTPLSVHHHHHHHLFRDKDFISLFHLFLLLVCFLAEMTAAFQNLLLHSTFHRNLWTSPEITKCPSNNKTNTIQMVECWWLIVFGQKEKMLPNNYIFCLLSPILQLYNDFFHLNLIHSHHVINIYILSNILIVTVIHIELFWRTVLLFLEKAKHWIW